MKLTYDNKKNTNVNIEAFETIRLLSARNNTVCFLHHKKTRGENKRRKQCFI